MIRYGLYLPFDVDPEALQRRDQGSRLWNRQEDGLDFYPGPFGASARWVEDEAVSPVDGSGEARPPLEELKVAAAVRLAHRAVRVGGSDTEGVQAYMEEFLSPRRWSLYLIPYSKLRDNIAV